MLEKRELVSLHFGQAGIQMGNAIWETLITEHGILNNGTKDKKNCISKNFEDTVNTLFHHSPSGQYIPRSLIVDTEPTVVDEIRCSYYRDLFHPDLLISGIEDAANNFARGYYSLGKRMLSIILEKIRYVVESCNNFKGFMSYSGSGGGTGSGLYALVIERAMLEYSGKFSIESLILPGKKLSDSIVEPYNTVLKIGQSVNETDLNILIDNESLYKICSEQLQTYKPTYNNINRLLAPIFSSITAPFRFGGPMAGDLLDISTNLVPYPKINFPSLSYSPFMSTQTFDHTMLTSYLLTHAVFQHDHSLLNVDIRKHKIMSSFLVFRGNHNKSTIMKVLSSMKKENAFQWVDWCPTGFKVSQSIFPPIQSFPAEPDKSVLMLCNNSGVINNFKLISEKFRKLHSKKSFVHWYVGEGMEYDELTNAYINILQLINIYEEACQINKVEKLKLSPESKEKFQNIATKSSDIKHGDNMETISSETRKKSLLYKSNVNMVAYSPFNSFVKKVNNAEMDKNMNEKKSETDEKISEIYEKNTDTGEKGEKEDLINENLSIAAQIEILDRPRISSDFVFSNKAKEILMNNLTGLSPELKERMLGLRTDD